MKDKITSTFLLLTKIGLGYKTDNLPERIDWKLMRNMADVQGLSAIFLDAMQHLSNIGKLTGERAIDAQTKMQWIGSVFKIEHQMQTQWKVACELGGLLRKNGLITYVLKGQVIAECWPIPSHRISADMDCFLKQAKSCDLTNLTDVDCWERGNLVVEEAGYKVCRDFYKNSTWLLPGLMVENHKFLTPFRGNRRLMMLENFLQSQLKNDCLEKNSQFKGTELWRPPIMLSALFMIEHAYSHFLHEGLTWRMVLDWTLFSKRHKERIDWKLLSIQIDEYGFRKFYDSFYKLGNYITGDLEECRLSSRDKRMLDDIWAPLALSKTLHGVKGKLALAKNTWKARWKYDLFTDISWITALKIQSWGVLFNKRPQLKPVEK